MDFRLKQPLHLLALGAVFFSVLLTIVFPIFSYFLILLDIQTGYVDAFSSSMQAGFQIILTVFQLIFVFVLFVGVPLLWYVLVNHFSLRKILAQLQLKKESIDIALLLGILGAGIGIMMVIGVAVLFTAFGVDLSDASNVSDLEALFSIPLIFVIVLFQPVAEEIFFRGFLFEKFSEQIGVAPAILLTSVLFGLAHLSYGKVYPALMAALLGIIFAYLVLRTKNLYTSITAHILFNVVTFSIYLLGQEMGIEAVMI